MKKNFLKEVLLGAFTFMFAISFVACSDYDDDIKDLQGQIDANKTAIDKINSLVNGGSVITNVTSTANGVSVTLSDGKSFELKNGEDGEKGESGSVVTIGENGNWYIDDKDTGLPAKGGSGVEGKDAPTIYYEPGTTGAENGYWVKVTIEGEINKREVTTLSWVSKNSITVVDTGDQYTIKGLKNSSGEDYGDLVLNKFSSLFVSSLTYIPSVISDELGDIVFLPVIGTDYNSTNTTQVYEYNKNSTKFATTLVDGWADVNYRVNPTSINPDNYNIVGFTMDNAWYKKIATRDAAATLNIDLEKSVKGEDGLLKIKANAKDFVLYSTDVATTWTNPHYYAYVGDVTNHDFNNPAGKVEESPYSDNILAVNTASLRVSNKNDGETSIDGSSVDAPYIPVARMVVPQEETSIALNVTSKYIVTPADDRATTYQKVLEIPNLKELFQMYTKASTADQVQTWLQQIPVLLEVPFKGTTNLNDYVEGIARKFMTTTGFESKETQYLLESLNFDAPTFKFIKEEFELAEVDQTNRYLQLENGVVSFDQSVTAAINREPVVKVQMYIGETLVMTKLLKMRVVDMVQTTLNYPAVDLGTKALGCQNITGSLDWSSYWNIWVGDGLVDDTFKFDFDQIFNKLGMSKDQFVQTYTYNGYIDDITATKNGADIDFWGSQLAVNMANIFGSAITSNNYVYFGYNKSILPGKYTITLHMVTDLTTVQYNEINITVEFEVKLPVITASRITTYWSDEITAELNVNAPETAYSPAECIFETELNSLFKTTNKSLDLVFNPTAPTKGDYDCVTTKYRFTAETKVLKADGTSAGTVTFSPTTGDRLTVMVGNVVIANISAPTTTGQTIELVENATVKELLSTGALKITNLELIATGMSEDILVKKFDVNFVRPLTLADAATKKFKDAQDFGDDLKLTDIIALTDWRGYKVVIDGAKTVNLEEFYDVVYFSPAMFANTDGLLDNSKIFTNLKKNATTGDYEPDNSITTLAQAQANNVKLPDYTKLTVSGTTTGVSTVDSDWVLNYKTNMATVQQTYYMWVPVTVTYKWGTVTGYVMIGVDPVN